jgi:molybdopterin-guanine dinucleotide biosynthesis protein B
VKAVGIVGYKKSGKTTLGVRLSQELAERGQRIAVIKHVSGSMDFPDTDSSKYKSHATFVSAISSEQTEIILKGSRSIEEMLTYVDSDIVLIEGFKREKTFPKIVCLRDESEKTELFDGLELLSASFDGRIADFNILDDSHIKRMAEIVIDRSFKLPDLDCAHCGYESCFELAKAIVNGKETIEKCVSLNPPISLKVDGTMIPLNPFATGMVKNTILGMLSSLKGYKVGSVEIKIP